MADSSADYVFKAQIAEEAERFDDMVDAVTEMVNAKHSDSKELAVEERNLLSVAYKNVVGVRRSAWRVLAKKKDEAAAAGLATEESVATEYMKKVEKELIDLCNKLINLVEEKLLTMSSAKDASVFYLKMQGDYHRYLAEIHVKGEKEEAQKSYEKATKDAAELPSTNSIRLGLALNYSVFQYEILSMKDEACDIAKTAFDEAIGELDSLEQEDYKDATLIMQLIRDNLTLWTNNKGGDEEDA
mmetsp:Transcript_28216/g.50937  ORF Transcript_28216/g.50937 Transcript_28216/m.50937 type:complete len:243 (+) Transcript_28216:70-798(+)